MTRRRGSVGSIATLHLAVIPCFHVYRFIMAVIVTRQRLKDSLCSGKRLLPCQLRYTHLKEKVKLTCKCFHILCTNTTKQREMGKLTYIYNKMSSITVGASDVIKMKMSWEISGFSVESVKQPEELLKNRSWNNSRQFASLARSEDIEAIPTDVCKKHFLKGRLNV